MGPPPVSFRLCVGGAAVEADAVDFELDTEPPVKKRGLEIFLIGRGTSTGWLETALGLRARVFPQLKRPIVEEIKAILAAWRRALPSRASRIPDVAASVEIRGDRSSFGTA